MRKLFTLLPLLLSIASFAQTGIVKGIIIHLDSKLPYNEVVVSIAKAKVTTASNAQGEYQFSNIPYGTYEMTISADGVTDEAINVTINQSVTTLDVIELKSAELHTNNDADNALNATEDASTLDENTESASGQNVASALNASRDPYQSAATFGWGSYFFRMRGLENDNSILYLNGVPMNDLEEGGVFFNSWSGLNDVFRGKSTTLGLGPNETNFGGMGLNTNLDASASNQRKGTRLTYTATNRSYRNRLMLTLNSGLKKNGWAYSFSLSRRWAQDGQIKGTFYDAYGYFAAVEKRFKKQGISFMIVGAPIKRGKNGPATKEVFELAGTHYYNPYWGYQNGKIRNSRVLTTHSPLFILSHDAKLGSRTTINSAVAYQFGETATTGIDWYNTSDPKPDYYKYLPSYQDTDKLANPTAAQMSADKDKYLQIDWDRLYEANALNKAAGYQRSLYIVNSTVEATKKLNVAVNAQSTLSDHITLYSGISYQNQNNHNFLRVEDLMGGEYWVNVNQFAERGVNGVQVSNQFDQGESSNIRKEGDHYGYDYNIHFSKASWFAQGVFVYNKFDFFVAGELGYTNFYRTGNYTHGLYPNNSKGNSSTNTFFTPKLNGGITYKLNVRNYLYANGSIGDKAPYVDNVIISPRTRNLIISNPRNESFSNAEIGYLLRSPNIKTRLTFFVSDVKNAADIKRYFDDATYAFSNMAMQGINKRYTGLEFGAEIKLDPSLTLNVAAALTQAYYTSRPIINVYSDNDLDQVLNPSAVATDTIYMENYYVPAGPQTAFQAALNYRSKKYWYATISANYLGNNWIDFTPTRRTKSGVDLLKYESEEWGNVVDQQKLPSSFTVDINAGKSFKVNKYIKHAGSNYFLNLNVGVSNILNNKNIILYGFENLRTNNENPDWFPSKYAYALGIQYFVNAALRF